MNSITLISAYFENPLMLAKHRETWSAYSQGIKEWLEIILVDDCSIQHPLSKQDLSGVSNLKAFRLLKKVRWNQHACRNLGASQALNPWLLMVDMDTLVPAETMRGLIAGMLDQTKVYQFHRVSAPDFVPDKSHCNCFLISKILFDALGGYDERLAGCYNTDWDFLSRMKAAFETVLLDEKLVGYGTDVIPDASTTCYERSSVEDSRDVCFVKSERALNPFWRPKRGIFPSERII